jgi:hypothetical protein
MSISGGGAYGSAGLDPILRMLSRLDNTTSGKTSTNAGSVSATPESAASTALTGTSQAAFSDQKSTRSEWATLTTISRATFFTQISHRTWAS